MKHLFCFGMGYSALHLARHLSARGWTVSGTSQSEQSCQIIRRKGFDCTRFDDDHPLDPSVLDAATHILVSIPPGENGDRVWRAHCDDLAARAGQIEWLGYLSTTGVYGDRQGGWCDETSPLSPSTRRGEKRVAAEGQWMELYARAGLAVHIFRLAGIYGPGSSQLEKVAAGTARRRVKPGQVFSRIHVEDLAGALMASISKPQAGRVYNLCDDEAVPPQDVVAYAASLLGVEPPPEIPFDPETMTPMGLSFFAESKRVSNRRMKDELGYELKYPTYREGLKALLPGIGKPA